MSHHHRVVTSLLFGISTDETRPFSSRQDSGKTTTGGLPVKVTGVGVGPRFPITDLLDFQYSGHCPTLSFT